MYKREGYTGILITDHFFNGSTTVPREGKWEDRATLFCENCHRAKARGDAAGLDVFFGWRILLKKVFPGVSSNPR